MQIKSDGFIVRISPSLTFSLKAPQVDSSSLREWEIDKKFEFLAHIYPEEIFRDYLGAIQLSDSELLDTASAYVRICDLKRWCEIAICANAEVVSELKQALQICGINAQLEASLIFPAAFRMADNKRIFVTSSEPCMSIYARDRQ